MAQHDDAERTEPVGDHRNDAGSQHERHAAPRAAIDQAGIEHAEGDRGDQEAQPGAGLGDVERALRDFDEELVHDEGDAGYLQPDIGEGGGEALQVVSQEGAERHQEEQVEQRRAERPGQPPAQHHQEQQLHEADGHQLPPFHDPDPFGSQPGEGCGNGQQRRPQGRARHREIQRDRQHEPAMAVGGRGVPGRHRPGDLGAEQQRPGDHPRGEDGHGRPQRVPRPGGGRRAHGPVPRVKSPGAGPREAARMWSSRASPDCQE